MNLNLDKHSRHVPAPRSLAAAILCEPATPSNMDDGHDDGCLDVSALPDLELVHSLVCCRALRTSG